MTTSGVWIIGGLALIMGLVLLLPFFSKKAEEELESFLFLMGVLAISISGLWSRDLITQTFQEPIPIALIVLGAGFIFRRFQDRFKHWTESLSSRIGVRSFLFVLVTGLGLLSALVTSIITPLVLAEVLTAMRLSREAKVKIAVIACLAIGLGSALTPWGGPLTAIAVAKLEGNPYHADFFFLAKLLGPWLVSSILGLGAAAALFGFSREETDFPPEAAPNEPILVVFLRALKIYVFVVGLVLLGTGFTPMADRFITTLSPSLLYWVNTSSAFLDNASLAAAEISPRLPLQTIEFSLMGLLLSGVMLIPGNLPNIILANKLGIKSGEWAKRGIPLGLGFMLVYFFMLTWIPG